MLFRDSTVYLSGNLLQKAAAFILLPVYTHSLSTAEYGLLEVANSTVNLLLVVVALMVPNAINKCYHRDCHDEASKRRLLGTVFIFSSVSCTAVAVIGWIFEQPLSRWLFSGIESLLLYRFVLGWLVLAQLTLIPLEFLRTSGRSYAYLGLSLAQLVAQTGSAFYLLRVLHFGLTGALIGNLLGFCTTLAISAFVLSRIISWQIDLRLLSSAIAFGTAMIPVFISSWIIGASDRFFLQSMAGLGALGVYALAYKFGAMVDLLVTVPFQRAWTPIFFAMNDLQEASRRLAQICSYLVGAALFLSLAITLAVRPFLRISSPPSFQSAAGIVPFICLAYLLSALSNCLGNGLVVAQRVRLVAANSALGAGVSLLMNFLLIPLLGAYGAALSTILAFGASLAGTLHSLRKHYPIHLEWGRLLRMCAAAITVLLGGLCLPPLYLPLDVLARLALLLGFPTLVFIMRIPRPDELARLQRLVVFQNLIRRKC